MVTNDEVPAQPKKKALPFKRTVARKQQSQQSQQSNDGEAKKTDGDNDLDFFRHTDEVFPEILREVSESKDEENHDRKRRKLSSPSEDPGHLHQQPVTLDESDNDLIMDVKGKGKEIVRPRRPSTPLQPSTAREVSESPGSSRAAPRTADSRTSLPKNTSRSPNVPVTVLDSDTDDTNDVGVVKPTAPPSNRGDASGPTSPGPSHDIPSRASSPIEVLPNPVTTAPSTDEFSEWVAKARALQASESHSAVVDVLTTSRIEGCDKPVRVRCRMNQEVQIILRAWIERTRSAARVVIPDDVAARMFLTWKGNKIYGHSTLASLGVQVDAKGRLRNNEGEGYTRDGIHLEVWTEEEYAEYLENRGKKRASRLLAADEEDDNHHDSGVDTRRGMSRETDDAPATTQQQQQQQQQRKKGIRIVLKARDHEPLKVTTRDDTTVEMLVEAFRAQRNLGPEWDISVWFDGERLEEDSLVTDLDIDPDDVNQLEVHVKKSGS
ncbi:hypothetical protein VTH82DRAFT_4177 [Thermothelomyces myriococcoides]